MSKAEISHTTTNPRTYTVRWFDRTGAAREHRSATRQEHVEFMMSLFDDGFVSATQQKRTRFFVIEGGRS